jgi:hypothetical protein
MLSTDVVNFNVVTFNVVTFNGSDVLGHNETKNENIRCRFPAITCLRFEVSALPSNNITEP